MSGRPRKKVIPFSGLSALLIGGEHAIKQCGRFADLPDDIPPRLCRRAETSATVAHHNMVMEQPDFYESLERARNYGEMASDPVGTALVRQALWGSVSDDVLERALAAACSGGMGVRFMREFIATENRWKEREKARKKRGAVEFSLDNMLIANWTSEGLWLLSNKHLREILRVPNKRGKSYVRLNVTTIGKAIRRLGLVRANRFVEAKPPWNRAGS